MFQVVSVIAVLAMAVPAAAQPTATVDIDFPGAAAVEAGMSDPKPVDPDAQGRRRASIVVPIGDEGTVYTMKRPDGTIVVRLVSNGQPAPTGFKVGGRYRAGQRLTFDSGTLTVTTGGAGFIERAGRRFGFGARGGVGSGSLLDIVEKNCMEIRNDLGLNCTGSDRGGTWELGLDATWPVAAMFDVAIRGTFTRTPEISIDAKGSFEGFDISSRGTSRGDIWTLGAEVGVSPTPRIRLSAGGGFSPFHFDHEQTFTFLNQTEREDGENSGIGRSAWGGVRFALNDRWSLYGEAGRTWLKDSSVGEDEEEFYERYSRWMLGIHYLFFSTLRR
jgi:hypothetical protein